MLPAFLMEHADLDRDVVVTGAGDCLEVWDRRPGPPTTPISPPVSPTSPPVLTILLDMTAIHVPVLAGELIEALDPRPGQVAIDARSAAAATPA